MTEDEAKDVLTYAENLWPTWKADDSDLDAWRRLLARVRSPQAARDALRDLKTVSDWRSPHREKFLAIMAKSAGGTADTMHDGHPGMYIQCVKHQTKPWLIGYFSTLCWRTDKPMPDEQAVLNRMHGAIRDFGQTYGGEWQLIRNLYGPPLTDADMQDRRAALRQGRTANTDDEPF